MNFSLRRKQYTYHYRYDQIKGVEEFKLSVLSSASEITNVRYLVLSISRKGMNPVQVVTQEFRLGE